MATAARVPLDDDRTVPCRRPANNPDWWSADKSEGGTHYADFLAAAKLACLQCRRRVDCLTDAADDHDDEYGVRGGLTPTERAGWTVGDGDPFDLRNFPEAPKWYPKPFNWQGAGPRCDRRNLFAAVAAASAGVELRVVAEEFRVSLTSLQRATHIRRWAPELVDDVCDGHVQFREAAEYALRVRSFFSPGRPAVVMGEAA